MQAANATGGLAPRRGDAPDAETRQVAPRHRPVGRVPVRAWRQLRDSAKGISKQDIRRLARRGGVKRIGSDRYGVDIYTETRAALKVFLQRVLEKSILYTTYSRRKTVTSMDIVMGLKQNGITLYGHGCFPQHAERPKPKVASSSPPQQTIPPPPAAQPPPASSGTTPPGSCCPQGHALIHARAAEDGLRCDECHGAVTRGDLLHSCAACDFDRCGACNDRGAGATGRGGRSEEVAAEASRAAPPRPGPARVALVRAALRVCFGSHDDSCCMATLMQQLPRSRPAPAPPFEEDEVRRALRQLESENFVMYRAAQAQIHLI